jgi:hypothetical protein
MSAPPEPLAPLFTRILEKFSKSREFTVSFILHLILVALFGTAVLFEATQEPANFQSGEEFLAARETGPTAPPQANQTLHPQTAFDPTGPLPQPAPNPIIAIPGPDNGLLRLEINSIPSPVTAGGVPPNPAKALDSASSSQQGSDHVSPDTAARIADFARHWSTDAGRTPGSRVREFDFFAFIGRYAGGDWNSTARVQGNQVTAGSLPNLLWWINAKSNNRIKTNDKNVRVIDLSSDELFSVKPPFIFMTGTRDFRLTEREVENLQRYVRSGGAIWGDSSLPGRNSRFDIAFRREMRRVIPDVDKDFEPLPHNHPLFTSSYFPEIREVPPGVNFYSEPVYALSIYGEIGILYTANDYGDMWQIGLDENDKVDLRRDQRGNFVAINREIWENRFLYLGNISPRAATGRGAQQDVAQNIADTYKFGTNIIVHLLTRWDRVIANAPSL